MARRLSLICRFVVLNPLLTALFFLLAALATGHGASAAVSCNTQGKCCSSHGFCVVLHQTDDPKHAHFHPEGRDDIFNVRVGTRQWEVKPGQLTFTSRKSSGPTVVLVQGCARNALTGSYCSPWERITVATPFKAAPSAERVSQCQAYRAKIVAQLAENKKLKCGFSGARWATNPDEHFTWCLNLAQADTKHINSEDNHRAQALAGCAQAKAKATPPAPPPYVPPPLPPGTLLGVWDTQTGDGQKYTLLILPQGDNLNVAIGAADKTLDGSIQASFFLEHKRMNFILTQPGIGATSRGAIQLTNDDNFSGTMTKDGGGQTSWTGTRRK